MSKKASKPTTLSSVPELNTTPASVVATGITKDFDVLEVDGLDAESADTLTSSVTASDPDEVEEETLRVSGGVVVDDDDDDVNAFGNDPTEVEKQYRRKVEVAKEHQSAIIPPEDDTYVLVSVFKPTNMIVQYSPSHVGNSNFQPRRVKKTDFPNLRLKV